MKITQDVRDYAAKLEAVEIKLVGMDGQQEQVVAEVESGMARMAETFKETGGEIHHQAAALKQAAGGGVSSASGLSAPPTCRL